jgi:hypothetical protein
MAKWRVEYRASSKIRTAIVEVPGEDMDPRRVRGILESGELLPHVCFVPGTIVRVERHEERTA